MALTALSPALSAIHNDSIFELGPGDPSDEGGKTNILGDSSASNGPDWNDIFNADGSVKDLAGGIAATFLVDDRVPSGSEDRTTFSGAGGSNKNNDQIAPPGDTWHWDTGNVPAKDDLANVYAYATVGPAGDFAGDLIVYAGFERIDSNGDSHIDVELFQDNVALVGADSSGFCATNDADSHQGCHFSGAHMDGDIIVSMDFKVGGSLGSVTIHKWSGSSYGDPVITLTGEGCNPADGGIPADTLCAFNNGGSINGGDWPNFDRHGAVITDLPKNAFTEFGFDVTKVLGERPCITTIMGKTRSSQSFTAELKDFAGPTAFPLCELSVTKEGPAVSKTGDTAIYTITVSNDGQATLFRKDITDDVIGDLDGPDFNPDVISSTCDTSLAPLSTCTIVAKHVITAAEGALDTLTNTVTATYNSEPSLTGQAFVRTATHTLALVHPAMSISKTGDAFSKTGDTIHYTITIRNDGDVALMFVSISDPLVGDLTVPEACNVLDVAEACEIAASHVVTAAEGLENSLTNTVSAVYKIDPATGLENRFQVSAEFTTVLLHPDLSVSKTGSPFSKTGDTIEYMITVRNEGDVALMLVSISDPLVGALVIPDACSVLDVGGSCQIAASHTVTVAEGLENSLTNTVTAVYKIDPQTGLTNEFTREASVTTTILHPAFSVSKTGSPFSKTGDTIDYVITVRNDGDVALMFVSISDPLVGVLTVPEACNVLDAGESCDIAASHTVTAEEGAGNALTNTVTAVYKIDPATGLDNRFEASASFTTTIVHGALSVSKTGSPFSKAGDTIGYTIKVSNDGDVGLVLVSIDDPLVGALVIPDECQFLAAAASCTILASHQVTDAEGLLNSLENTVTAVYKIDPQTGLTNEFRASASFTTTILHPALSVTKTGDTFGKTNDVIDYTITISNDGDVALVKVSISDPLADTLTVPAACDVLGVGESCQVSASHTVTAEEGALNSFTNTASVVYKIDPETGLTNQFERSSEFTTTILHPELSVSKTGSPFSKTGDTIDYKITVKNEGDVALVLVSISDPLVGALTIPDACNVLDVAQSCEIAASHQVTDAEGLENSLTNTVTAVYKIDPATGLTNEFTREASFTTTILHPSYTVTKSCQAVAAIGDTIVYTITIVNTGDVSLNFVSVDDSLIGSITVLFGSTLGIGATVQAFPTRVVEVTDPDTLTNTVSVDMQIDPETGLTNRILGSAECSTKITRPFVKLTSFGYTNEPTDTQHGDGITSGVATFTIVLRNFGTSAAFVSGSLEASASALGGGSISCSTSSPGATLTGCALSWDGIFLTEKDGAGDSVTFVLEVTYTDLPDGSVITADLASTYTPPSGTLTFTTSGSPASISFTVRDSP